MATRSNKQPLKTPNAGKFGNWKDHPLIIAATSFGAGLVFSWQFVTPVQTARLEARLDLISEASKNALKQGEDLKKITQERDDLKGKYGAMTAKSPLSPRSSMPRGFDGVKLGDPVQRFLELYPTATPNGKSNPYFVAKTSLGAFNAIVAYPDSPQAPAIVSFLFIVDESKLNRPTLVEHAKESFGPPTYLDPDGPQTSEGTCWRLAPSEWVCIGESSYRVTRYAPSGYQEASTKTKK